MRINASAGSLWELVEWRAATSPESPMAVDEQGRRMTFGEFALGAERVASGLETLGVEEGSVVAWQLPTRFESMVLIAALARLGAVQVPLLPAYREREVMFIVDQSRPRLLVLPGRWRGFDYRTLASAARERLPGLTTVVADPDLPTDARVRPAAPAPSGSVPDRWRFYTSGTTGTPKGVCHSDRSILAGSAVMAWGPTIDAGDRAALAFPMSHIGGAVWLGVVLMTGCCALVIESFDPVASIDFLDAEGMTLGAGGTVFVGVFLEQQRQVAPRRILGRVRAYLAGASAKPPHLYNEVTRAFPGATLLSAYGMTECPIATCSRADDPADALAGTEGRAAPGVEVVVRLPDGSEASPGEEGELFVRGPQLFGGYLDHTLDRGAFDEIGCFRTGDLGHVDDRGFVTISGRTKEVIIRKGETISAREVEDLLAVHPGVAEVAVIGLPDPVLGEQCCAVVVADDPDRPIDLSEIVAHLRATGLMAQKLPERIEVVDHLPRNALGKVSKHELVERFAGAH